MGLLSNSMANKNWSSFSQALFWKNEWEGGRHFLRQIFLNKIKLKQNYDHGSLNKNFEAGVKKTNAPRPEKQKINFVWPNYVFNNWYNYFETFGINKSLGSQTRLVS